MTFTVGGKIEFGEVSSFPNDFVSIPAVVSGLYPFEFHFLASCDKIAVDLQSSKLHIPFAC